MKQKVAFDLRFKLFFVRRSSAESGAGLDDDAHHRHRRDDLLLLPLLIAEKLFFFFFVVVVSRLRILNRMEVLRRLLLPWSLRLGFDSSLVFFLKSRWMCCEKIRMIHADDRLLAVFYLVICVRWNMSDFSFSHQEKKNQE